MNPPNKHSDHNIRQHLALNLNGEIYILPESFEFEVKVTRLESLIEQKLELFNKESQKGLKPLTKNDPYKRFSNTGLLIRKFEDLQIHPWLLNATA